MHFERFTQRLEAEKEELEGEMAKLGRKSTRVPGDWEPIQTETGVEADLIDQADIIVNRDTESAIFADLEARYDTVLAALARIKDGSYGTCETCGKEIEEARLNADPAATTCVAHK